MPYDNDTPSPYRFRPIDLEADQSTEVPSDLNRRAVLNKAEELSATATAIEIAEELRLDGRVVPIDEVRGALAGM